MYEDMIILKGHHFAFKNKKKIFGLCRYETALVIN